MIKNIFIRKKKEKGLLGLGKGRGGELELEKEKTQKLLVGTHTTIEDKVVQWNIKDPKTNSFSFCSLSLSLSPSIFYNIIIIIASASLYSTLQILILIFAYPVYGILWISQNMIPWPVWPSLCCTYPLNRKGTGHWVMLCYVFFHVSKLSATAQPSKLHY